MKTKEFFKIALLSIMSFGLVTSCEDDDNNSDSNNQSIKLFASNNANGNITVYDLAQAPITTSTLLTTSTAADGVFFDSATNTIVQASRSSNGLEGFNVSTDFINNTVLSLDIDGSDDMDSPRELAVNGNFYVVADNADVDGNTATPDGRLFVYQRNASTFTLRNVITTDFKLWGITFIGNDLYAVVDADNELAVFTNFLSNTTNATLSASKRIVVEGIVRTHGLTYDAATDVMVMTDIGLASNGQDDGGFHVITNFIPKFTAVADGGTLAVTQQTRVSGAATLLGNPVDVAYDGVTGTVFIAEAGNGGGRILAFSNIGNGGNLTPVVNNSLASASSVYLSRQ
ncbi:hypothetical protein ACFQ1Q_00180 [Winogradskyella litorisediminis]|uniref:NHL repeat containing protein n=1 Tax=Winogradskyella litorisediminis TaxID=1156618 RepID=A0ABW3N3V4_9FLAO